MWLILSGTASFALAQDQIGLEPPSRQWWQIKTEAGKVIFPEGADSLARVTAGIMLNIRSSETGLYGPNQTKKVTSILRTGSTLPAGFSTPAPWRNEYYLMPPQNHFLGTSPWAQGMISHEYKHTQQFSKANQGFTRVYQVLMGQTGWVLNSLGSEPLWFREGDAVLTETKYTNGGRGRLPAFHMEYKALLESGAEYSYEKATWFSFKDFVPNPYRIGYYMVSQAQKEHGGDIWGKVLDRTFKKTLIIYPFSRALKKETGKNVKELYEETIEDLSQNYADEESPEAIQGYSLLKKEANVYTNYRYPHFLDNGEIICLKSGFEDIGKIVKIGSGGKEEILAFEGIYTTDHSKISVGSNLICWSSSSFHPRWNAVDYSDINLYDLKTGKQSHLTRKGRYFSPTPSWDDQKIAAVHIDQNFRSSIVIFNINPAFIDTVFKSFGPENITHLRWTNDNQSILFVALGEDGNSLQQLDIRTGKTDTLIRPCFTPISAPFEVMDFVYFSAGTKKKNDIYVLQEGSLFKVTNVPYGAFDPAVSNGGSRMVFSNYTALGYSINVFRLLKKEWKQIDSLPAPDFQYHKWEKMNASSSDTLSASLNKLKKKRFHRTPRLPNVYGWFPIPNITEWGAEFYLQDKMSTYRGTVGAVYNTNEDRLRSYFNLSYAALFPVIELEGGWGERRSQLTSLSDTSAIDWTEKRLSGGLRFPLNLSRGSHATKLEFGGFLSRYGIQNSPSGAFSKTDFDTWRSTLSFSRLRQTARRHLAPRWGQSLSFEVQRSFQNNASKLYLDAKFFAPGISKSHSFQTHFSAQEELLEAGSYRFLDRFMQPRGYDPSPFERIGRLSFNYAFPIWYPDIAINGIAFFQRLRTNLFVDLSKATNPGITTDRHSLGAEMFIDLKLLRLFQMDMGLQYSYLTNPGFQNPHQIRFIVRTFEFAN